MGWKFYNSSGQLLSAVGSAASADLATVATTVTVSDNEATDENNVLTFVAGADADGGNVGLESDGNLHYNPSTGKVTATSFAGNLTGAVTGNAATATALASARTIGGVSFDGTGNINLPGVNTAGNQATSGLAATATLAATTTALAAARTIGGVSFDGTGNINLPGVNTAGNQATSGLAATATLAAVATAVTVTDNEATAENNLIPFVADAADGTGNHGLEMDGDFHYNPNTGVLTVGSITGGVTGSATQITVTAVTDDDTVYPVFATATSGANTPEVASALTYNPSTGLLTATGFSGPITGNLTGTLQTAVQAGITTVGTIDTGVWEGTTVAVNQGGTGITSFGTGVATFIGTPSSANLRSALTDETGTGSAVFATSPTLVTPALGTPASGDLTNCTNAGVSLGVVLALS